MHLQVTPNQDREATAIEQHAFPDVSQGAKSVAPPSVSIPTAVITDNKIIGPSPLTLPSNTSNFFQCL
jgi:hypothetical protein